MIAPLVAFPALLAYFAFVAWRVRVEKGVIVRELTPLERLARACREIEAALALALEPILRGATEAFRVLGESFVRDVAPAARNMGDAYRALARSIPPPVYGVLPPGIYETFSDPYLDQEGTDPK